MGDYASNVPEKPRLLDQLRAAIRVRHYSIRTEESYVRWVREFILFCHKRHSEDLGEAAVSRYLTHMAVNSILTSLQVEGWHPVRDALAMGSIHSGVVL